MRGRAWIGELRTWVTGVDPGLGRLRLAGVATAAEFAAAAPERFGKGGAARARALLEAGEQGLGAS